MTLSSEKRVSIADASSGISDAAALLFARVGIRVPLVSRSQDKLEKVARSAQEHGVEAKSYPGEIPRVDRARNGVEIFSTPFGPIDLLVNRVGASYNSSPRETYLAGWQRVLDLNLSSIFECVRAILPSIEERRQGTIVNLASICATQVLTNWGADVARKLGLMVLSKTPALKEQEPGIRMSSICQWPVNTSIGDTKTVRANFDRSTMRTPQTISQIILQVVQLPPQAVIEERTLMSNTGVL